MCLCTLFLARQSWERKKTNHHSFPTWQINEVDYIFLNKCVRYVSICRKSCRRGNRNTYPTCFRSMEYNKKYHYFKEARYQSIFLFLKCIIIMCSRSCYMYNWNSYIRKGDHTYIFLAHLGWNGLLCIVSWSPFAILQHICGYSDCNLTTVRLCPTIITYIFCAGTIPCAQHTQILSGQYRIHLVCPITWLFALNSFCFDK